MEAQPLVLHGSWGVADDGLTAAVRAGMVKVNVATHLNHVWTDAMVDRLTNAQAVDIRNYIGAARETVDTDAARLMILLVLR